MHWTEAWERDRYEVGRAMHEGWKRQKIVNGFADHPLIVCYVDADHPLRSCTHPSGPSGCHSNFCPLPADKHHGDMIDWDDLPPHQQAINFAGGEAGYRMGFEAGKRDA